MNKKIEYITLLSSTKREGIDNLIAYMDKNGFFNAPCSTRHHLAEPGGLLKHSMNVYNTAKTVQNALNMRVNESSLIIACLLHDLGKSGQYGKPYYVPNILKSGKTSAVEPFIINKELLHEEHEVRSLAIALQFIELTESEQHAILHHNGSWGKLDGSYSPTWDKSELTVLVHFADLWCSRFLEV